MPAARQPAAKIAVRRRVTVGTQFRATFQDGNCLWVVKKRRGAGTWDCVVDASDLDYGGTKKVFGSEDILGSLHTSAFFQKSFSDSENFWKDAKIGSVVHYHNGFGQFVRGTIMIDHDGKKGMMPIALVGIEGAWRHDLPRRRYANGKVMPMYHADNIINRGIMTPHPSNIYECSSFSRTFPDPANMVALDLTIPPLEGDAANKAMLWDIRQAVITALSTDTQKPDIEEMLKSASSILKNKGF